MPHIASDVCSGHTHTRTHRAKNCTFNNLYYYSDVPPSQGGKYAGFGSTAQTDNNQSSCELAIEL